MLLMCSGEESIAAFDPAAAMEVTLGLVNWPEKGLSVGNLWGLGKPQPIGVLKERRLSKKFLLSRDTTSWAILGPFMRYVLGDAGFVDYEKYLDQSPPHAVLMSHLDGTGLSVID